MVHSWFATSSKNGHLLPTSSSRGICTFCTIAPRLELSSNDEIILLQNNVRHTKTTQLTRLGLKPRLVSLFYDQFCITCVHFAPPSNLLSLNCKKLNLILYDDFNCLGSCLWSDIAIKLQSGKMKCNPEREKLPLQPMPAKTAYPVFAQDSGPLQVNNQQPSSRE